MKLGGKMKLNKFMETTIINIIAFRDYWLEGNKRDPEKFPIDLSETQWYERLTTYQETRH